MEIILMIGLFVVLGYFMLVRPARTQAKKQSEMLDALEPGARVMTRIGVYGTLVDIGDVQCRVEIAPDTIITLDKSMLAGVTPRSREEYWVDPDAPREAAGEDAEIDDVVVPDSPAGLDPTPEVIDPDDRRHGADELDGTDDLHDRSDDLHDRSDDLHDRSDDLPDAGEDATTDAADVDQDGETRRDREA